MTGVRSAHDDKKLAARGMRRKQNAWLYNLEDFDEALIPHRLECAFNNTWSWGRDGRQSLYFPDTCYLDRRDWAHLYWLKLHRK